MIHLNRLLIRLGISPAEPLEATMAALLLISSTIVIVGAVTTT